MNISGCWREISKTFAKQVLQIEVRKIHGRVLQNQPMGRQEATMEWQVDRRRPGLDRGPTGQEIDLSLV